jgi:3-hydroxyisobutyrate dehydrogenase-like beta-hydroxyacid dehydrogenase
MRRTSRTNEPMSKGVRNTIVNIAIIGYGEVGRILAEDLAAQGHTLCAFDLKLAIPESAEHLQAHAQQYRVKLADSCATAIAAADLVISAVTASQTVRVAQDCAAAIRPQAFFLDFNSASPAAKIAAAQIIERQSARYVEGAVMTSVPPYRIKVPLLLGGPHAQALAPLLTTLGFSAKVASDRLGVASATKMCRSIMIKGLEAMIIESFTTARHYGVEDQVIASLYETYPGIDWEKQGAYCFQRVIEHGRRRSEEVREVAVTVQDAGLTPWSANGTADRQAWVADHADAGLFGQRGSTGFAREADWRIEADRILAALWKD